MTTPTHSPYPALPDKASLNIGAELAKRQESIDGLKTALGAYGKELARLREQNRQLTKALNGLLYANTVEGGPRQALSNARAALAGKGEQQ